MGRLSALWLCCGQAVFCYGGTEIIGLTANEAERPRETVPKTVRRVPKRLWLYYSTASFVLGLNLSANDPRLISYITNPTGSYQGPYVLMAQRANVKGLEHVLNAVGLIACLSVANANLYETVQSYTLRRRLLITRAAPCMRLHEKDMLLKYSSGCPSTMCHGLEYVCPRSRGRSPF